jgi:protein gp37
VGAVTAVLSLQELGELERCENVIERGLQTFQSVGLALVAIRDQRLYRGAYVTFEGYCQERWGMARRTAYQAMDAASAAQNVRDCAQIEPANEHQTRPLTALAPDDQRSAWREAVETAPAGKMTGAHVASVVADMKKRQQMPASMPTFNRTNDNIEWAWWSWNPVTGCLHDCPYCYARDIANRFYAQGFAPTFHADRLSAPQNTKVPALPEEASLADHVGSRTVFVCSMADLFGEWVPQEWIDAVLDSVRAAPQWTAIFLTKNPDRLVGIDFPDNAWVGATVDTQARVAATEAAFWHVKAGHRFVSCEPLLEPVTFYAPDVFDWFIVGGCSGNSRTPASQPEWLWVESIVRQAREVNAMVYMKTNLTVRAREYPED